MKSNVSKVVAPLRSRPGNRILLLGVLLLACLVGRPQSAADGAATLYPLVHPSYYLSGSALEVAYLIDLGPASAGDQGMVAARQVSVSELEPTSDTAVPGTNTSISTRPLGALWCDRNGYGRLPLRITVVPYADFTDKAESKLIVDFLNSPTVAQLVDAWQARGCMLALYDPVSDKLTSSLDFVALAQQLRLYVTMAADKQTAKAANLADQPLDQVLVRALRTVATAPPTPAYQKFVDVVIVLWGETS